MKRVIYRWKDAIKAGWTFAKAIALDTKPVLLKAFESQTWGMFRGMMVKNNMTISVEQADTLKGSIDRFSWNYVRLRPRVEGSYSGSWDWFADGYKNNFADLIWNLNWSKRFNDNSSLGGRFVVWEQSSGNGWMGEDVYRDLEKIMTGMNAQKLIQSFEYSQVLMDSSARMVLVDSSARTVPFSSGFGSEHPRHDAGVLRELTELGFELSRVGATNPAGMATESSAWLEAVMEGNAKLAGEGLSQFAESLNQPDFGNNDYAKAMEEAIDYAQRLVQVAGAVDDPVLDAEVMRSDTLSELVNLGGAYAALEDPYRSSNISGFFLATLFENVNTNQVGSELETFFKSIPLQAINHAVELTKKSLKALQYVPAAKPFINNPDFLRQHMILARDFVQLNPISSIDSTDSYFKRLDDAKSEQDIQAIAQGMQSNVVALLKGISIGGDDGNTTSVLNPFIVDDSNSLELRNILNSGISQFDLKEYSVYNVVAYAGNPTQQMVIVDANKGEDFGKITFNEIYSIGASNRSTQENHPYVYILRNGDLYYYPDPLPYTLVPGEKLIIPKIFASLPSPGLGLSNEDQVTIKSGIEQIAEFSKPLGLFVSGALYQWAYDVGETGRSILTTLLPDWRKLDQSAEEALPKDPMFIAGRLLGNGAGVITGLLGMISGASAIVGGTGLCITGVGCLGGAPAIAVGSALTITGAITLKEALENAGQNAADLLSSGLNTFFSRDSSNIGSGNPQPPSKKSVNSLMSEYPGTRRSDGIFQGGLAQDEAYAIQDILERASTKKDGIIRITEKKVAQLFKGNQNKGNWPEAIVEKRNGTLVAIEVKNQVNVEIANAVDKFENLAKVSNDPQTGIGKKFSEFILYLNRDKFFSFKERSYSVGKGNILFFEGKPFQVDGKTIQIKYSDLKPR